MVIERQQVSFAFSKFKFSFNGRRYYNITLITNGLAPISYQKCAT